MKQQNLIAVTMPGGAVQLEWEDPAETIGKSRHLLQGEIHKRFESDGDLWLMFLGFSDPKVRLSASLDFWRGFAALFAAKLAATPDLEELRQGVDIEATADEIQAHLERAPLMTGAEYLTADLLGRIWAGLKRDFEQELASYRGSVADFIKACSPKVHLVGRVFFHLVENKNDDLPFAFLATYSTRLDREGRSKHLPLKYALQEYEGRQAELLELLSTVHLAAKDSAVAADLLASGDIFHPLGWTAREAFRFLKEIPLFEKAGILCRIPNWWQKRAAGITLDVQFGDKKPSVLGMDAILNFNARLLLDGIPITADEARRLLQQSEGLAFIKNKWVVVDPQRLEQTLAAYEKAQAMTADGGLSLKEALRLQLTPGKFLGAEDQEAEVTISNGQWLQTITQKLRQPARIETVAPGKNFKADLRAYQQRGLNWLYFLHTLGFGACLADDMGLGKTVEVLAFLNRLKTDAAASSDPPAASLLVIPASLISNWTHEIERFAPALRTLIAHPGVNSQGDIQSARRGGLDAYDLVITTYALAHRYKWLQAHPWQYVILDEAQAIKNPGTQQTRAVKKIKGRNRIVMTGTPIENRLSDLWSLFDFVNPGLLGTPAEFKKFSKHLNSDPSGYARLRRLIHPYVLRRLKTDKKIITDLPDKVEMKTYAGLSKQQVLLYGRMVEEIRTVIAEKEGIARKGLILSSLMKFKQLCNHPDQYLGTGTYDEKDSGKFSRLREICETIYAKREKVLVFTQFKEMTGPLCDFLSSIFERRGLVLHGSIAVGRRKNIIREFQQDRYVPFMVLSLKAGGVGLNLTAANHVIHFDRWWNPAVENQATDRAFRIGQQKKVVVHKFITRGTVEEKIDQMLAQKARLADDVIAASGEAWITDMDDRQLIDLFRLSL